MGAARRSRRKSSGLTGTDQFAGCGGTGQVMDEVLKEVGGNLVLAMNHWKLATQTYATNQVNTDVACTDHCARWSAGVYATTLSDRVC
jgi:hypothetical protein